MAQVLLVLTTLFATAFVDDAPRVRVLFIGNSLTSANGLPAMVEAIAAASGFALADFAVASVTRDGFSLRDLLTNPWNCSATRSPRSSA